MKSDTRRKECIVCNVPLMGDMAHIGDQYPFAILASSLNLTKCSNHDFASSFYCETC